MFYTFAFVSGKPITGKVFSGRIFSGSATRINYYI